MCNISPRQNENLVSGLGLLSDLALSLTTAGPRVPSNGAQSRVVILASRSGSAIIRLTKSLSGHDTYLAPCVCECVSKHGGQVFVGG